MKLFATLLLASALLAVAPATIAPAVQSEASVAGVGEGVFPDGASFNGVPLTGSTFGIGVLISGDGSAVGEFQTVLAGSTLVGPQDISVVGSVTAGSLNADGSATFSGTATVDMGDGLPPADGIPFSVTASTSGLQLVLATTTLPAQTLDAGTITIE
jgi:hypothetical protein